jgi:hypothetical protein
MAFANNSRSRKKAGRSLFPVRGRRTMFQMTLICLACGEELQPALADAGSLRCQDCRDTHAPLRADFATEQRAAYEAALLSEAA